MRLLATAHPQPSTPAASHVHAAAVRAPISSAKCRDTAMVVLQKRIATRPMAVADRRSWGEAFKRSA
jgi:hypothetical protein